MLPAITPLSLNKTESTSGLNGKHKNNFVTLEATAAGSFSKLAPSEGVEELHFVTEEEYFPPPRELRPLINAIGFFANLGFSKSELKPVNEDRSIGASEVLTTLT